MAKRTAKRSKRSRKQRTPWVAILGIAAIFVAAAVLLVYLASQDRQASGDVVRVNGEPITATELEFQYDLLPAAYKAQLTREQVLEQIIDEELIMQEARRSGVTVTPEDINEQVQNLIAQGGLTPQDLQANLDHYNVTMEEFEGLIERQILIQRFLAEHVQLPEPTDEELEMLYETMQEQFSVPAQVTVRHVLVASEREDAALLARDIYERARAGEDFCVLVTNYTDDPGSRATCGEYTFPRGFMVPEFEEASFGLAPGEFALIQTQFGYHIIEKLADLPEGVQPMEDVRDELAAAYQDAEYARQYAALVSDLRDEARIEYVGIEAPATGRITEEPAGVPDEAPAEAPPAEEAPAPDDTPVDSEPPVEPEAPQDSEDAIACIAQRAVLYGASWNADTRAAMEQYPSITIILCDETPNLCAGIQGYPTWRIGQETFLGRMTLEQLREATGC